MPSFWPIAFAILLVAIVVLERHRLGATWRRFRQSPSAMSPRLLPPEEKRYKVQPIALFLDDQKIGTMTASTIDIDRTAQQKGGFHFGLPIVVDATTVLPEKHLGGVDLLETLFNHDPGRLDCNLLSMRFFVSGVSYLARGGFEKVTIRSTFETGEATGVFRFRGEVRREGGSASVALSGDLAAAKSALKSFNLKVSVTNMPGQA